MEKDFDTSLIRLDEKFKREETTVDYVDTEKCLREFKTELYIKRDQVKQLRNDLEIATAEVNDLKKALAKCTKSLDEKSYNLNILQKKFRSSEAELFEKIDALNSMQLQHKLTVTEIDNMKEILQKTEIEKSELSRQLGVLETKEKQSLIYHNQILKRETQLRTVIEDVQKMMKKLERDQSQIKEFAEKTKLAEDSNDKFKQLSINYKKLKSEKDHFEELYTKINAKYEMFQELANMREDLHEPNLFKKVIFNQWKSNRQYYDQQLKENLETIKNLTDCYNNEKLANNQLIIQNRYLTEENEKLKLKLGELDQDRDQNRSENEENLNNKDSESTVKEKLKEEPIEIFDD